MQIDVETLKLVTAAFLESERPFVTWSKIAAAVPDTSEEVLAWYLDLLHDDGFLVRNDGEFGIGVQRDDQDNVYPSEVPLRLTSQGMNFASNLHRPESSKWLQKALAGAKYVSLQLISGSLQSWAASGFVIP